MFTQYRKRENITLVSEIYLINMYVYHPSSNIPELVIK